MNKINIQQSQSLNEVVNASVIDKLYRLALQSKVEDQENNLEMSLSGRISPSAAYEDSIIYLNTKFPNLIIDAPYKGYYIRFQDPEIERVLIANNVSSDGIGITGQDAQSLQSIPNNVFKDNTTVSSFSELSQFGAIKIGNSAFMNSSIQNIDLSTVTQTETNAFRGSSISSAVYMPNLISLGSWTFQNCKSLTEVTNLGYISKIPGYNAACFANCSNLTKVVLPQTCTILGNGAFADCSSLTYFRPLNQLISLEYNCLGNTGDFGIAYFENVTTIAKSIFGERGSTPYRHRQIYFPKLVNTGDTTYHSNWYIHDGNFQLINTDLIYFRDLQNFYPCDFDYTTCVNLIINNVNPPMWNNNQGRTDEDIANASDGVSNHLSRTEVFYNSNISNIYVPDSAVNTYKNNIYWSTVQDKIKPLSQLAKVATEEDLQEGQIALIEEYM